MTDSLAASAAAYALGATDEPTRIAIEQALPGDPALSAEVDAFREVAALLGLTVPAVAPPPALRERVMASAVNVRPLQSPASTPQTTTSRDSRLVRAVPWLALAAALGGVAVLYGDLADMRAENAALVASAESIASRLAATDSLLATVLAPDVRSARLASSGLPPSATMYFNPRTRRVVLAAWQLPPAAGGRTYQLWAIAKGAPVSLGTFNTMPGGEGRVTFTVPQGVEIAVGAVTEEPAGGSPQPTSAPFLVGNVAAGGG